MEGGAAPALIPMGAGGISLAQFFLVLGVSYFLLLEYHSSSGMPMEGRVITPKAAQSSCEEEVAQESTQTHGDEA